MLLAGLLNSSRDGAAGWLDALTLGSVALEPALGLFALLYSRARAENMKHHRLPRSALSFTRVTLLGLSQRIDREVAPKQNRLAVFRGDAEHAVAVQVDVERRVDEHPAPHVELAAAAGEQQR